jgi:hypothetical protein
MFKFYFLDDDIEHNTSFQAKLCIMIISPFSSSHFAIQIFPIDELRSQKKPDILMTVAGFFRKYSVGCILNYVRLVIIMKYPVYIYSYSCSSALRSVRSQHNV